MLLLDQQEFKFLLTGFLIGILFNYFIYYFYKSINLLKKITTNININSFNNNQFKMVILIRQDLEMSHGKIIINKR